MHLLRRPIRLHLGAAGVVWLVLAGAAGAPAAGIVIETASDTARLDVVIEEGILTLQAKNVALGAVLAAVAERAGFEVSVHGPADIPITADVAEVPLEQGLQRLLEGGSAVFLYDRPRGYPARRLVEVRVHMTAASAHRQQTTTASTVNLPAAEAEPGGSSDEEEPAISIYDPLEDRLAFARTQARLARTSSPEEVTTLLLEDEHANVRGLAAAALGRRGGTEAGEALVEALADHDWRVRRRAVRALGQAWGYQAVEPLAELLSEESSRSVRRIAIYTLSRIEGDAAREALAALQDDPDPNVRGIATFALEPAED